MQLITVLASLHLPKVLTHFLRTGAHHDPSSGASQGQNLPFPYAPSTQTRSLHRREAALWAAILTKQNLHRIGYVSTYILIHFIILLFSHTLKLSNSFCCCCVGTMFSNLQFLISFLFLHIYLLQLVGARDLRPLWSPSVSLNLVHVLVFFRNF
jgi:hypothetical protein